MKILQKKITIYVKIQKSLEKQNFFFIIMVYCVRLPNTSCKFLFSIYDMFHNVIDALIQVDQVQLYDIFHICFYSRFEQYYSNFFFYYCASLAALSTVNFQHPTVFRTRTTRVKSNVFEIWNNNFPANGYGILLLDYVQNIRKETNTCSSE